MDRNEATGDTKMRKRTHMKNMILTQLKVVENHVTYQVAGYHKNRIILY